MWNALKNSVVRFAVMIARGFVWWMEMTGKNPALSRDFGFLALNERNSKRTRRESREEAELPAGELRRKGGPVSSSPGRARRVLTPPQTVRLLASRTRHRRWRNVSRQPLNLFLSH
jgi:hypothetical protein